MKVDISEPGGAYQIFVAEDNSSFYVRLLPNDAVGMDGDIPYTFYRYPGTPGTGPGPSSTGGDGIMSSSTESTTSTPATSYGYALDGRRVGKAGVVNMKYLYDGENVVYELWDDKTVRFTHPVASGSCGSCGPCGNGGSAFFTDHPISITILDEYGETAKYYYLYDGLGSVTELIDANENVVNAYRYAPFGEALVREETVYNPHQFTGRQYDAESGLYHYRARAYSSDIGRFLQQDPAGMVDGPNLYAYCGNNPVNRVDPMGMRMFRVYYSVWGFTSYAGTFRNYMLDCIGSTVSNEYVSSGAIAATLACIWFVVSTKGIGYAIAAKLCAKGLGTATVAAIVNCAEQFQSVEHHSIIVWHTFVWYLTPTGYKGWVPT